ncbi:carbohydrate ABC transporter substrate-binding protein (CUT1 family) [Paenibacillus cellulosilyticus]|uniref:Carbohydrate ABC transporter substrate-binding protein (CUT1 family) n=1 Tax=Paenibacillus cellulosilyticus TaxID=375489 RepID=A0A2V2YPW6_9BACL|nr:ABC transporter substrate-binding protein [Paenibacillus cellulosilyticus]PWV95532.1 carbohydrate ABC transporter substrate-binding protein (CUT1 family) [Paenibacillus cellulosilyticus]QKS47387.1 ABC transporter substrate-binding protein [Paenibacillus cellulosilyticus]
MKKLSILLVALTFALTACGSKDDSSISDSTKPTETSTTQDTTNTQSEQKDTAADQTTAASDKPVNLNFYFPVAVGGPITGLIDKLAADFNKENPNITVTPTYAGNYQDTMTKVVTAVQGGNSPDLAVLLSTELYSLLDMNALEELTPKFPQTYFDGFYEAFMGNTKSGDQVWSVPFQRSTIVLYYNKDMFKAAGLDPEKAPTTWDELRKDAAALTVKDSKGAVSQWGLEIPSTGYQYWMLQALSLQTGTNIVSNDGTEVFFNKPEVKEALQFYTDLGRKDKVMPEGVLEWATVPSDFISGKTAMMFHTTGNLTKVKTDAKFDFGVAYLPANRSFGSPTGGGNLYVFKDIPEDHKAAALKFIEFLTTPERVAQWSIDTGYVGTTKAAYETDLLKNYVEQFPQASVARDQMQYASSELSTHQNGQITKLFNDNIQAALLGTISAEDALEKSQQQADDILKQFKK